MSAPMPEQPRSTGVFAGLRHHKKSVITLLIFVCYAAAVFWSNYHSLRQLQSDALLRFQLETEKQAAAISYYFTERQNDISELAESDPVVNFFKNRDLGMSYRYGLGVNVELIEERFAQVMSRKRVGDWAIYSGLALVDGDGLLIAHLGRDNANTRYETWLAPGKHETRIRLSGQHGELLVSSPVWINQTYYGELLAWTDANTSLAQFGRSGTRWYSVLIDQQNAKALDSADNVSPLSARLEQALKVLSANGNGRRASLVSGDGEREKLAVAKVDIGHTPLAFVSMTSDYPAEERSSRWMLFAAGGIPFLVLLLAFLVLRERHRLEALSEQARIEAEHLAQARGEFLANMSHEIRTPMNAIVGMTELCLGTSLNDRQLNYLNKIQGASNSLLRIINDILDFSRIESGQLEFERLPFDLDQVFEDIGSLLAGSAAEKSIELVFDVDDSVRQTFVGDPLRLEQILINLIGNAIKFSERGTVVLRVRHEMLAGTTARLYFAVIDQGIGLSEEQQSRLFHAFAQADTTTTRRYGGTGLGLTICKRLVELMGGSIRVDSTLGQGSTFHFFVDLEVDAARVSGTAAMAQRLSAYADRPLLLVAGNPILQSAITSQLNQIGLVSEVCTSLADASNTVSRAVPGNYLAVLVDVRVLDTDRTGAVSRLRGLWADVPPPFILLSSDRHERNAGPVLEAFDRVLIKPISPGRLFEEIAPFLGIKSRVRPRPDVRTGFVTTALKGLDILLVDDVPLNQEVVRDMLEGAGVSVRLANNGSEAIAAIAVKTPDGVLMDCQMPVMDGYEATRRIRADERYRALPIIALTANALVTERQRCLEAGMDGYVAKPVKSRDLLAALAVHFPSRQPSFTTPVSSAPISRLEAGAVPTVRLPELPGIDCEAGLVYANGNPKIYSKILRLFRESHGRDFEPNLRRAIAQDDWPGAARVAHTLKGSARTIGANLLGSLAQTLEEACLARQPERVEQLLEGLLHELTRVSAGLVEVGVD